MTFITAEPVNAGGQRIDPTRRLFELTPLGWGDVGLLALSAPAWALLVMLLWRVSLVDRLRLTWRGLQR